MALLDNMLFSKTAIPTLTKALDAYYTRSQVIANNIANISTKGYKRREVKFEEFLQDALSKKIKGYRTNSKHLPIGRRDIDEIEPEVYIPEDEGIYSGDNNVDIDKEMAKMAENQILYNLGVKLLNDRYTTLKKAITSRTQV